MSTERPARDIGALGAWAVRLLVAQAALSALAVIVVFLAGPGFVDESVAYGFVALAQMVLYAVAGIVVLRWIWFATANVQAFGAEGLPCGPWLAVGAYFIPIVNLVLPFQSMRATWKASVEPRDWEVVPTPALLGWWWAAWLAGNVTGLVAFRLSDPAEFGDAGTLPATLTMVSDALTVAASLVLAAIVRRVTTMQQVRASFA